MWPVKTESTMRKKFFSAITLQKMSKREKPKSALAVLASDVNEF